MNTFILILFIYLSGVIISLDLIGLIEKTKNVTFTRKELIKLALCSWYSCIVLRNTLIGNKDD